MRLGLVLIAGLVGLILGGLSLGWIGVWHQVAVHG
jgi:hypothetical protein